jgi:uncharacterized protein YbjT (DUF2867 family)
MTMDTQQRIAVTGATGRLGSKLVDLLDRSGYDVVPIARSTGVDVITGKGLDNALTDVGTVVACATGPSPDKDNATHFFVTAADNVQNASEQAGVQRIVLVSIIGCDRFVAGGSYGGYYTAKVAQEQAYREGRTPTQILRAAQFHEFVGQMLDWGTQGDVGYVPAMRTQLVAARTVAEALALMATRPDGAKERSAIPEIAGPRAERLVDMARLLAERGGAPARVEEISDADDPNRELLAGDGLLPAPQARLAGPTFEAWLR